MWALIVEPDSARAAQYSYLAEHKGLTPSVARSAEEAAFAVLRLSPLGLILTEAVLPDGSGLELLAKIRETVPTGQAPAIVLVDSRDGYEAAARAMIPLGICGLLPHSHTLGSLEKAIDRALQGARASEPPPRPPDDLPEKVERPTIPIPEHLGSHPLVQQLASMPGLKTITRESLRTLSSDTAHAFGAAIALVWLDTGGQFFFELHLEEGVPRTSPLRTPGRWAPVRRLIGGSPLYVPDVADHPAFAAQPLLPGGQPAALAGAPLASGGAVVGTVAIVQPHVAGRAGKGLLEPLLFWAQRISGDLERLKSGPPRAPESSSPPSDPLPVALVLEDLVQGLDTALMITDEFGVVRFVNAAMTSLLAAEGGPLAGRTRAIALRNLSTAAGVEDGIVSSIVGARQNLPRESEIVIEQPVRRVLFWRARVIALAGRTAQLDEFADVTSQFEKAQARETLVRVDAFTGLANRAALEEALGREIARAVRTGFPFSIALFSVDNLRMTGAGRGEQVFRNVAWVLRATARPYDLAARLDRLRLIAVLSETTGDQARVFAERFLNDVRRMSLPDLPRTTVSGGVAQFDGARNIREMLQEATAKLAEARRLGGDRVA